MKKISKLVLAFCLSFVAFFAFGSNKAFAYSNRGPQALTSTSVYVDYKFNTVTIKFQSDTSWAAYISSDFVYSYQSQGNASGTYTLTYYDPTYPSDHRIFTVSPVPTIKPGQYTKSNFRSFELYLRNGSR